MEHKLGWLKDPRDERDYKRGAVIVHLPDKVDLSAILPSVRDQGNLGSCTGFGIGGNLTGCAKDQGVYTEWFSPTWIYNGGRLLEGTLDEDSGCYPRDNLEFIREYGCLLEHFRPYKDTLDETDPTDWGLNDEAAKYPIIKYTRLVDGVDGILSALADGYLVSIGSPWYDSWFYPDAGGNLPEDYLYVAGGHEYLCYGYDKVRQVLLCQNSWGTGWGNSGKFTVPFSAIEYWKYDGGYDAHIIDVDWVTVTPEPTPKKKWPWVYIAIAAGVLAVLAILIF